MSRRLTGGPLRRVAGVTALCVVAGALAGVAWELAWTPPQGIALDGSFALTSAGLPDAFDGTALYAVLATATGLLLGVGVTLRSDGAELVTLLALAVGSLVAAPVMALVGSTLGPPDPDEAARDLPDYTLVQQALRVEGVGAYLALPSGALLGAGGVYLSLSRRRSADDRARSG
jgi:hypothetical protein